MPVSRFTRRSLISARRFRTDGLCSGMPCAAAVARSPLRISLDSTDNLPSMDSGNRQPVPLLTVSRIVLISSIPNRTVPRPYALKRSAHVLFVKLFACQINDFLQIIFFSWDNYLTQNSSDYFLDMICYHIPVTYKKAGTPPFESPVPAHTLSG